MKKAAGKTDKPPIDWEGIEREYRAGIRSVREIATAFGISDVAIHKRAKRDGWVRDLAAKIRAQAEALVSKDALPEPLSKAAEREIVDANAEVQARVMREHRKEIGRNRALSSRLLAELEAVTAEPELFAQLGELLNAPDDRGIDKLNELYRKVIALPSRIDGAKKLAETLKILIGLEREAFGIKTDDGSEGNDEEFSSRLIAARARASAR